MSHLTVAIPVYNGMDYLEQALGSIGEELPVGVELLVSDGGSVDGTGQFLRRWADGRKGVSIHVHGRRLTQVENCNFAVQASCGTWVQFLCHDDILLPGAIALLSHQALAASDGLVLAGHQSPNWYGNNMVLQRGSAVPLAELMTPRGVFFRTHKREVVIRELLDKMRFPQMPSLTSAMVRREKFIAIGGFDTAFAQFDTYCWYRLLLEGDYAMTEAALSLTRIHSSQVTSKVRSRYRLVSDARRFWTEWIESLPSKGFSRSQLADLIPLFKAGTNLSTGIYISMVTGRREECASLIAEAEADELLVSTLLLPRAMLAERWRTARSAAGGIPLHMLYP